MAKRTIRKTDPDDRNAPERRPQAERNGGTSPRPRAARSRKNASAAPEMAAADYTTASGDAAGATAAQDAPVETHQGPIDVPHEYIAVRAYHLYLQRGGRGGDEFHDWITAERELREQAAVHRAR